VGSFQALHTTVDGMGRGGLRSFPVDLYKISLSVQMRDINKRQP
jgi:hypothetical protein